MKIFAKIKKWLDKNFIEFPPNKMSLETYFSILDIYEKIKKQESSKQFNRRKNESQTDGDGCQY